MTIEDLINLLENYNRIEVNFNEEDKVELILPIEEFYKQVKAIIG
mgnify:CR=1 FL=1